MTLEIYSLENTIASSFKHFPPSTRKQCKDRAIALLGGSITPCPIQGSFSYTVYAGAAQDKIVQLRTERLDTVVLKQAYSIFGHFVPKCLLEEDLGGVPGLRFYVMQRAQGVTYLEARMEFPSLEDCSGAFHSWRMNAVGDFAR